MRGQWVFRDCGPTVSRTNPTPHSKGQNDQGYVGVGIIEAETDMLPPEEILPVLWPDSKNNMQSGLYVSKEGKKTAAHLKSCELADIVTHIDVPRPQNYTNMKGGALILRKTRLPCRQGHTIYVALLVLSLKKGLLNCAHHYNSYGHTVDGLTVFSTMAMQEPLTFDPTGMALPQIHKLPIWGWDEEPWAPVSTLALDVIDQAMILEPLTSRPRTPMEERRYQKYMKGPAGEIFRSRETHDDFGKYLRAIRHQMPPLKWDGKITASEQAIRDDLTAKIVRELF